jgi:excisionase family DNA binding protein
VSVLPDPLLSAEEVAPLLSNKPLNPRTVQRLAHRGELAYVRIGGQLRFRMSDVQAYIDRQHVPARSGA